MIIIDHTKGNENAAAVEEVLSRLVIETDEAAREELYGQYYALHEELNYRTGGLAPKDETKLAVAWREYDAAPYGPHSKQWRK